MLRVGLTGGIGAGKSTVSRRLAELGAVVVDADLLAREVVAPGSPGLGEVVAEFGPSVLTPDGSLDRAALGALVFGDPGARRRLEALTHPRIRDLTEQRLAAAPHDAVVVHDVPLLVELGYEDRYHLTVVVHAEAEERVRRLVSMRGSTPDDARRRMASQADDDARRRAADVWLDNGGDPDHVLAAVDVLWRDRLVPFDSALRASSCAPRDPTSTLSDPQPGWGAVGLRLAARVRRAVGEGVVRVDHVGSTAVPGLLAADVVDVQLVVAGPGAADDVVDRLAGAGFPRCGAGRTQDGAKGGRGQGVHGSADPGRRAEVVVRTVDEPIVREALLLRDWLRADPGERRRYAGLKQALAREHPRREDYLRAREPWFAQVALPRMRAWAARTGWAPQA